MSVSNSQQRARSALPLLTSEQLTQRSLIHLTKTQLHTLNERFDHHRDVIQCYSCKIQDQLSRQGTVKTKASPLPYPRFLCKKCGKVNNVNHILAALTTISSDHEDNDNSDTTESSESSVAPQTRTYGTHIPSQYNEVAPTPTHNYVTQPLMERFADTAFEHHQAMPEFLTSMMKTIDSLQQEQKRQQQHINELLPLLTQLEQRNQQLSAAKSQIHKLETTVTQLQQQLKENTLTNDSAQPKTVHNTNKPTNNPWHDVSRLHKLKKQTRRPRLSPAIIERRQQAAARAFMLPSKTQGFDYIYFPHKGRKPISETRRDLRRLEIENNRILDIHYPDRNIIGFLIHNDYRQELMDAMAKRSLYPHDTYDPFDPDNIRDPKLVNLPEDERAMLAVEHVNRRIIRSLNYIRKPVRFAVARDFYQKNFIDDSDLTTVLNGEQLTSHFDNNEEEDQDLDLIGNSSP